jgi:hypothetical protein
LLQTRAAAQAASGDFGAAAESAGRAARAARERDQTELAQRIELEQRSYLAGRALLE